MKRRHSAVCTVVARASGASRSTRVAAAAILSVGLAALFGQRYGHAQGVDLNPLPYSKGFLGTINYVVGGVDLTPQVNPPGPDGFATGTLHVNGVPPNAEILSASMYWESIYGPGLDPKAGVKFNGSPISPTGIKAASTSLAGNLATCWGAASGSGSTLTMLRADVLHLLPKQLDVNGKWTGKRLVNDADLSNNGHTVTLPVTPTT